MAAVEAVDDGALPPPELQIAFGCKKWGCLPEAGAYLDQDYALITRMAALSNVYNAYSRFRNSQGKQIHGLSESERRILKLLLDMRIIGT